MLLVERIEFLFDKKKSIIYFFLIIKTETIDILLLSDHSIDFE